jgi:hypothetical protein
MAGVERQVREESEEEKRQRLLAENVVDFSKLSERIQRRIDKNPFRLSYDTSIVHWQNSLLLTSSVDLSDALDDIVTGYIQQSEAMGRKMIENPLMLFPRIEGLLWTEAFYPTQSFVQGNRQYTFHLLLSPELLGRTASLSLYFTNTLILEQEVAITI